MIPSTELIKPGARFVVPYQITRQAETGEMVFGNPLSNELGKYWWGKREHDPKAPKELFVFNMLLKRYEAALFVTAEELNDLREMEIKERQGSEA